jgi:hypothetical protein
VKQEEAPDEKGMAASVKQETLKFDFLGSCLAKKLAGGSRQRFGELLHRECSKPRGKGGRNGLISSLD